MARALADGSWQRRWEERAQQVQASWTAIEEGIETMERHWLPITADDFRRYATARHVQEAQDAARTLRKMVAHLTILGEVATVIERQL